MRLRFARLEGQLALAQGVGRAEVLRALPQHAARAPGQMRGHEHGEKRDEGRAHRERPPPGGDERQERAGADEPAAATGRSEVVGDRGHEGGGHRHRKRESRIGERRHEPRAAVEKLRGKRTGDRREQRAHDVRARPREGERPAQHASATDLSAILSMRGF